MSSRSENVRNLLVVKRWQTICISAFCCVPHEPPFEKRFQDSYSNPASIVLYLQQIEPTMLTQHADRSGACIQRIFDKFLQGRCRAMDYFSCSYTIRDILGEFSYSSLHELCPAAQKHKSRHDIRLSGENDLCTVAFSSIRLQRARSFDG